MFGYVRPFVPEMKVGEYERYRAVYCGLCRAMGRVTGQLSRFTLSYDLTFFAAVRMILEDVRPDFQPMRCPAHPTKKRLTAAPNPALDFTAAVSAVLAEAKTADDLTDEHGFARLTPALRQPFTRAIGKRAARFLPPGTAETVRQKLEGLRRLEDARCPSADETAGVFGEVLACLFSLGLEGERADVARAVGGGVGRFVYLCDAADDLAGDVRRGRYNPLAEGWGPLALEDGRPSAILRDSLAAAVPMDLEKMGEAVERLDPAHPLTPIVGNIVYLGLPAALRRVLDGRGGERDGKDWNRTP